MITYENGDLTTFYFRDLSTIVSQGLAGTPSDDAQSVESGHLRLGKVSCQG